MSLNPISSQSLTVLFIYLGVGEAEGQGPNLHEQDLVRTIRDTGERERGAHRDTEGGWAGFTLTTGSQGFLSRIGQVAPGGTGAGAGLLLVALS